MQFDSFVSYGAYGICNPLCFLDGAVGGAAFGLSYVYGIHGCDGGFGGGGGSGIEGGGGGGYIGGVVAPRIQDFSQQRLCAALSLNKCQNDDNIVMESGSNVGNGSVEVTYLRRSW